MAAATVALAIALPQKLPIAWPAAACGVCLVVLRKGKAGLASPGFLVCHVAAAAAMLGWTAFVRLSGYGWLSESFFSVERWYFGQQVLLDWTRVRYFVLRMANGFSAASAALALFGAWLEWRSRRAALGLLAACGISAFLVFPNLNIVHTHYQLPILFAVAPLTGVGLMRLIERIPAAARPAALAVCLAGATAWGFQVARWSHFPLNWSHVEAARELQTIPQSGPQLFYVEGGYYPTPHYLARRRGLVIPDGTYPHSPAFVTTTSCSCLPRVTGIRRLPSPTAWDRSSALGIITTGRSMPEPSDKLSHRDQRFLETQMGLDQAILRSD